MTRQLIGVEIVNHRLVGMPHLRTAGSIGAGHAALPPALEPIRGIGIAVALSVVLWAALIVGMT